MLVIGFGIAMLGVYLSATVDGWLGFIVGFIGGALIAHTIIEYRRG